MARFLLLLFLLSGCASSTPAPLSDAAAPPAQDRRLTLDVHWVRNSAEFRAVLRQTYALAGERLAQRTAGLEPGTWAVALDADETVISNSQYQKELHDSGQAYSRDTWNAWVRRREATALPGVRAFLEHARRLGGRIVIVTNRRTEVCGDTEANFRALSLPFDVILCRSDDRRKEPRWDSVKSGTASPDLPPLDIVMWIGDNIEDFPGWDQAKRTEPDAAFDLFGDRYFVIPNPMYGSWTANPPN